MSSATDRRPNRLAHETSPYLLQHAYNPVDWYPWGDEALERARTERKPILLSIGYSACHWCHVMERESFENEDIAALMNAHFVCIKVDREERPDLDEIYMQATLALNQGQGGWPMTVFLTPEQQPFFAGTYFPPTDRWGRPGFATLLRKLADLWRTNPDGLSEGAADLTERLKAQMRVSAATAVGRQDVEKAVAQLAEEFDARYGGFGHAPKFPPATALSLLLRYHARTGDAHALTMVRRTLDGMAAGGMYDHIGGGFARYSTDERWLVPHFEKMLYDNALLARTYVESWQLTGDANHRRVAVATLDYILREMTAPDGGFYSATDADSEGVEGKFFVWTPQQVRAAVPTDEDARRVCAYYDITPGGNWEHTSIPHTPRSYEDVAADLGITATELRESVDRLTPLLYRTRQDRVPPGLDDKVLVSWNGMMISAMAEGARVLGDGRYREAARRAADFILRTMRRPDGGLFRTSRNGKAHLLGCLEDYAYLAEGLIDLYESGAAARYLDEARRLAERMVSDFADEEHGGFFTTATDHEALIVRSREGPDGATPSGNAVAASVLARLAYHLDRPEWRERAAQAVRVYGRQINRYPRAFAKSLVVVDFVLEGPVELAFIGRPGESRYEALWQEAGRRFLPSRIIAHHDPDTGAATHPLLKGRGLVQGQAALYICRDYTCQAPLTEPGQVTAALQPHVHTSDRPAALESARIRGSATPEGTARYAGRHISGPHGDRPNGYAALGMTGLTTCRIGFGGYRTGVDDPDHREALRAALRQGCNLIDTSTNYVDGDSERLVGTVLGELLRSGDCTRDEIIVVTKIGYIQGENLERAQSREQQGRPYPDLVKYADGVWHCIHPDFLAEQLGLSLDRLGLETLDVCLLHNPEYYLSAAAHAGEGDLTKTREEFYQRLESAFRYLESQVAIGRLQWYGVSSNTSTAAPDNPEATSLTHILECAERAATAAGLGSHHFRVVQCPMNLLETGALDVRNTGPHESETLLEAARRLGIAVLVNRPLNAMPGHGHAMIRLAELPVEDVGADFETQRGVVATLEDEYRRDFAPRVKASSTGMPPDDYFRWADELPRMRPRVQNFEHWEQIEGQMIAPHLNQVLRALGQHFRGDTAPAWERWRERYVPAFLILLRVLRREAALKSREKTTALKAALAPTLAPPLRDAPLSRQALAILMHTPGVTCVLNGMRTPAYVEDALNVLSSPAPADVAACYEAVRSAFPDLN